MNIARFENETDKKVDRTEWGLPVPNVEAAYISLGKYAKDVPALSTPQVTAFNVAFRWTERHFGPYMLNSRVKSQEEVLKGIDLSTSPGFPWTRKYAKKRAMVDDWKEFPHYMEEDWDRLRDPLYVAVFGNSLKEEIRPQIKIDDNSIRTFTAGPIEMTIHGNRLFEDMNEKFYRSHLKTASVVGFTPLKGGWNMLYRKLRKHPNGFALDESQYDSSLRAYMMWACAQFRWNMLRPEDQTEEMKERLLMYYQNLIHTVILTSDGVFVRKIGGNPSGSVNTISDNTLILYMLLAYGWIMLAPIGEANYERFDSEVALALCGDDNTWSVSNAALPYFNARALIDEWKRVGVTTTTDCLDPRPVEELDFLSAFTVFVDGIACPLYSREKILTSLLYSRNAEDPAYTLVRACALLRVGWTDPQLRGYLKELIAWMVEEYGTVLQGTEEWRQALCNIPTEADLYKLFLGQSRPMVKQSKCSCSRPAIKSQGHDFIITMPRNGRSKRGMKAPPVPSRNSKSYRNALVRLASQQPRPQRQRKVRRPRQNKGGSNYTGSIQRGPKGLGMRMAKFPFPSKSEFITDLVGSTTFGNGANAGAQLFAINPGQVVVFPWLSKMAQNFEKYVFTKLKFTYMHEVSEFATAGTTGVAILGFDYDAADPPFQTQTQILDSDPHDFKMPCKDFSLNIDCKTAFDNGPKYVRPGNLPGGSDIKTYDIGNLQYAAAGTADGTTKIGKLMVEYAGYFLKPVNEPSAAPANNQVSWFQTTTNEAQVTGVTRSEILATATSNGLSVVNTAGSMVPPAGNYLVDWMVSGLDSANEASSMTVNLTKNGTSVYPWSGTQSFTTDVAAPGAAVALALTGSAFLTANGTDVFLLRVAMNGAGGTLTSAGSVIWLAV